MEKIDRVKGLFSYQGKELDEILDIMADALLEKHQEEMKPRKVVTKESTTKGRYISKETKYKVYKRARGKCEICGGTNKLEYDHIKSYARSGTNDYSNIRLLYKNCNLRQGIIQFGVAKMRRLE